MPRFAANLTMLWTELDPYDRFRAAADAGFREVEMLFPHELDARELERLLSRLGLQMVLFDPAPGDWRSGERGIMCLPGREAEFLRSVESALELARRLGTNKINVLAGIASAASSAEVTERTALSNLNRAAEMAAGANVEVLVENINQIDIPGYWIGTVEKAAGVVKGVGHPNVRLQLDQYHATMAGENAVSGLREHIELIRHVQIADVPGRHQPGTGQAQIAPFLHELDQNAYAGLVGLEYRPLGSTEESFDWMQPYRAGPGQPLAGSATDPA